MVEPCHPFQRGQLEGFPRFPRAAPVDQFRLVQPVNRFRQRVVVAITCAADRRCDTRLGKALAVADAEVLRAPV